MSGLNGTAVAVEASAPQLVTRVMYPTFDSCCKDLARGGAPETAYVEHLAFMHAWVKPTEERLWVAYSR